MTSPVRYGVFLRPDPLTCAAVTSITAQVRAQYGLVSAGAFPPHATLAGSLPLRVAESELIETLTRILSPLGPFEVENSGVSRLRESSVVFDLHRRGGIVNAPLVELAAVVDAAVRLLVDWSAEGLEPDLYEPERWRGHLSLASHELLERIDLRDEVEAYVAGLAFPCPHTFEAELVALYRFTDPAWTGSWWQTMRWEHVRTWRLAPHV